MRFHGCYQDSKNPCPARVPSEEGTAKRLPQGWDHEDNVASSTFGDGWIESQRRVLIVPSVVAKYEKNIVIKLTHSDFQWVVASRSEKVVWDIRLFRGRKA